MCSKCFSVHDGAIYGTIAAKLLMSSVYVAIMIPSVCCVVLVSSDHKHLVSRVNV